MPSSPGMKLLIVSVEMVFSLGVPQFSAKLRTVIRRPSSGRQPQLKRQITRGLGRPATSQVKVTVSPRRWAYWPLGASRICGSPVNFPRKSNYVFIQVKPYFVFLASSTTYCTVLHPHCGHNQDRSHTWRHEEFGDRRRDKCTAALRKS